VTRTVADAAPVDGSLFVGGTGGNDVIAVKIKRDPLLSDVS